MRFEIKDRIETSTSVWLEPDGDGVNIMVGNEKRAQILGRLCDGRLYLYLIGADAASALNIKLDAKGKIAAE